MDWLQDNATLLTALFNLGMLAVWGFYLALFYRQYSQSRQPKLVLHLTSSRLDSAEILLVNLGYEPVHIQGVLASVRGAEGTEPVFVTDPPPDRDNDLVHTHQMALRQGPLAPASYMMVGRVQEILKRLGADGPSHTLAQLDRPVLDIKVVAAGRTERLIAARRGFVVDTARPGSVIYPEDNQTEQLRPRRRQREAHAWLEEASAAAVEAASKQS